MPKPHEGRVWAVRSLRAPFERAVRDAKLDAPLTFHDLRHHFASWFIMRGGRLEVLQRILGHATLAMTMRYAHLAPDYVRAEMVRTDRELSLGIVAQEWPNDAAGASVKSPSASEDIELSGAGGGS
jgi:integrase